ncbi:MAG: hemin uptake protein HemP [Planctomycetes bacterium]|nr:hemin uptake protein HemP [Planctomycetota bacterium]
MTHPPAHRNRTETYAATPHQRQSESAVLDSTRLFSGKNEVQILHDGQIYRLRVTKNGKLILNK